MRRFVPLSALTLLAVMPLSVDADDKKADDQKADRRVVVGIEVLEGNGPHTVSKNEIHVIRLATENPAGKPVNAKVEGDALKLTRHGRTNKRIDGKILPGGTMAEFEFSVVKAGKATIVITTGAMGETFKPHTKNIVVNVEGRDTIDVF